MASAEGNSLRSCANDTPEASAISVKPICSIGFSASNVRKAAMILSRSPAGAPAAAAGRRGERLEDLRVDRRAMTTLLRAAWAPRLQPEMYGADRVVPRCRRARASLPALAGRGDRTKCGGWGVALHGS